MIRRRQLPVASRVTLGAIANGLGSALFGGTTDVHTREPHRQLTRMLMQRYNATAAALVDSGTSALVHAFRLVVRNDGTVAFPAFCCVDLVAAAHRAGVRVRLYDVDPVTLSPDLDSLSRVLAEGVDAILVAHLFGFPADVTSVRIVADQFGVPVIEDAAQHAGATLRGARAGSLGDISILSFGRGKGITGGNGGAILALNDRWTARVDEMAAAHNTAPRGLSTWIKAAATWILGRPSVYAIPASIPGLRLGEMVYHDAHEPESLSVASATILRTTLAQADHETERRQHVAHVLQSAVVQSTRFRACIPVNAGVPGYLRFPVVADKAVSPIPRLGVVRTYPRPLSEQSELRPLLLPSPDPFYGAHELADRLLTLPTHHMVSPGDLRQLKAWLSTG